MARMFRFGGVESRGRGSVNFSMRQFNRTMERTVNALAAAPDDAERFLATIGLKTFELIVLRTPVDTGTAKAGWKIERNMRGLDSSVVITNGVEYIVFLEFGHSQQAPAGMVRITLADIGSELDKIGPDMISEIRNRLKGMRAPAPVASL